MPGPSCKDVSELFNFNSVALIYDYKTDDNHRVLKTDSIEGHQLVHTSLKSVPSVAGLFVRINLLPEKSTTFSRGMQRMHAKECWL